MENPEGYKFIPGQATDVSVNQPGMEEEKWPFALVVFWKNWERKRIRLYSRIRLYDIAQKL